MPETGPLWALLRGSAGVKLMQLLNCVRGRHERSRGHAWQDGDIFRSKCRGCGKPMIRAYGGWVLDTGQAAKDDAQG